MRNYKERITELKESLADGRIHQFGEVNLVINSVILITEQRIKSKIKNTIDNLE